MSAGSVYFVLLESLFSMAIWNAILLSSDSGSRQGVQGFAFAYVVNGDLGSTVADVDWPGRVLDFCELSNATRDGCTVRYQMPNLVSQPQRSVERLWSRTTSSNSFQACANAYEGLQVDYTSNGPSIVQSRKQMRAQSCTPHSQATRPGRSRLRLLRIASFSHMEGGSTAWSEPI